MSGFVLLSSSTGNSLPSTSIGLGWFSLVSACKVGYAAPV